MQIALDTNAYTAFLAGDKSVREQLAYTDDILLPAIVLGELYYGFYKGTRLRENLSYLARFMQDKRVTVGEVGEDIARVYGEMHAKLRQKGRPVPSNDMWIAAICVERGYSLLTRDSDFSSIPGLAIIKF
ncbi:MAG: type II toxin-antitoxin system VapC family toxin [Patescibacteria group bacterium]